MKKSKVLKTVLFVSGTILILGGSYTLISPSGFYEMNGADLPDDVNILNFARATGGLLLACGILIMLGLFIEKLTFISSLISSIVFLSYGIGRASSIIIDGMPSVELVRGTTIEFVVGFAALFALLKYREKQKPEF